MDTRAPAVVAVVVTTGPGPDLEVTLASLVAQDYADLSLLVLANGEHPDISGRVAAVAPLAFVKTTSENRGFGVAANEVIGSVQGAAFYLFCHDDIRLAPDAISVMVEAAYRTNSGIISPKFVGYDDETRLLHVGQMLDRFGAVVERLDEGEIDAGQHDAERDVFVAPGGAMLVRSDLFESLGGFANHITLIGEDVDLCWRAQVAGARIMVVPAAVVAHRQALSSAQRVSTALGTRRASLQDLRRRHQLSTVLASWSWPSLLIVIPMLLVFEAAEVVIAAAGRDSDRVGAVLGSWRYAFGHRAEIRRQRELIHRLRALSDGGIRLLQVAGASRAQTFLQNLFYEGIDKARGTLPPALLEDRPVSIKFSTSREQVFSENPEFDEVEGVEPLDVSLRNVGTGFRTQFTVVCVAALVWLLGARNLIAAQLPTIGRLMPIDSWWSNWHHFFASWSPNGVGTGVPAMPGYAFLAAAGTLVGGRMGILPRIVLILAVPIGAYGVGRLLRDAISNRARLFAALGYLALPVGVNLVQQGRIDLLIPFAGLPFLLRRIFALLNVPKFRAFPYEEPRDFGSRLWGRTRAGQLAKTVMITAVMTAFAPVTLILVLVVVLGLSVAQRCGAVPALERPWRTAGQLLLGVATLLLPMACDVVLAGRRGIEIFGLPLASWSNIDFVHVIRTADGVFGLGILSWLLPIAAFVPLVLARGERRNLASQWSLLFAITVVLVLLVGRNVTGPFAPDVDGLLILAALALSVMVGVSVATLEEDLREREFGWPHVVGALTAVCIVLSPVSILTHATDGRYGLPQTSAADALAAYTPSTVGGYRVLWLGDPRAMPLSGWSVAPGLAAATSMNGGPNGSVLFSPPASGASDVLLYTVDLVTRRGTTHAGRLLATAGVSDIVVLTASVPPLAGLQSAVPLPPPTALVDGLDRQADLALVAKSSGLLIYANKRFHGIVGQRATALAKGTTSSDVDSVDGWTPALHGENFTGDVAAGQVIAGFAPANAFALEVNGHAVKRATVLDWVAGYETTGGPAQLVLHQFPLNGLLTLFTVFLWLSYLFGFGVTERLGELMGRRQRRVVTPAALSASLPPIVEELNEDQE